MPTVPFVAKIKKDWRYPHRPGAFQFAERPPPGFQATEAPDWITGTVRGTVPAAPPPDPERPALPGGFIPGGAVGSLFDDEAGEGT